MTIKDRTSSILAKFHNLGATTSNGRLTRATVNLVPEVDADSHSVKYRKRRSVRDSPKHMVGLMIVFTLVLSAWHYGQPPPHVSLSAVSASFWPKTDAQKTYPLPPRQATAKHTVSESHSIPRDDGRRLDEVFLSERKSPENKGSRQLNAILTDWLSQLDHDIVHNVAGGIRWVRPYLLPSIHQDDDTQSQRLRKGNDHPDRKKFLQVSRSHRMKWQDEWDNILKEGNVPGPIVDYTDPDRYTYPPLLADVPDSTAYPPLRPLKELMDHWNHDEDYDGIIHETLLHFNYSDPTERAVAIKFRDAELPFKLYGIPEIDEAGRKWTVEYVDAGFRDHRADGTAQESSDNFFAFYIPQKWNVWQLGLAPVRNNDWDFKTFEAHARYADAIRLAPDQPHFYWQSGVSREQRHQPKSEWSFISTDLPSFSSPTETFFVFHPKEQKGIQCRFGERGVVAATHYDSGMNFVAMMSGAKRYILSPPRECPKQGMFTSQHSPIYRHSLLNFAHMKYLDDPTSGMSEEERTWLERAAQIDSIETVLKKGEALYIPSHWFHYIVSLQYSAQCNVRSGINYEGNPAFGSRKTVEVCRDY